MRPRTPKGYRPRPGVHPVINRLREARTISGLTQADIGEILGYSNQDIYKIETEKINTRFRAIVDYADYLGFDLVLIPRAEK